MQVIDLRLLNIVRGADGYPEENPESLPGTESVKCGYDIDDRISGPIDNVLLNVKRGKSGGEVGDILAVDIDKKYHSQVILFRDKDCHKENEADVLYLNGNERLWKTYSFDDLPADELAEEFEDEDVSADGNVFNYIKNHNIKIANIPNLVKSDIEEWW